MEELIKRNYNATVKRGLITPNTNNSDFDSKLDEEYIELFDELCKADNIVEQTLNDRQAEELTDIISVGINWLIKSGRDFKEELTKVVIKNERRANEQ